MKVTVSSKADKSKYVSELKSGDLFRHHRGSAYYMLYLDKAEGEYYAIKVDDAAHYPIDEDKRVVPVEGTLDIEED